MAQRRKKRGFGSEYKWPVNLEWWLKFINRVPVRGSRKELAYGWIHQLPRWRLPPPQRVRGLPAGRLVGPSPVQHKRFFIKPQAADTRPHLLRRRARQRLRARRPRAACHRTPGRRGSYSALAKTGPRKGSACFPTLYPNRLVFYCRTQRLPARCLALTASLSPTSGGRKDEIFPPRANSRRAGESGERLAPHLNRRLLLM